MSSREPLWYCHECAAEMRPLMMPDPHCASCRGTFVEKMENPNDDPRHYHLPDANIPGEDDPPMHPLEFLMGLQAAMQDGRPSSPRVRERPRSPQFTSSGYSIRIDHTGNGPARTVISSTRSPPTRSDSVPPIFGIGGGMRDRREGGDITGPLMFQYLAALLSQPQPGRNGMPHPLFSELFGGGAEPGRMGDYVFSQEALDQIMTQLMESSSSHPVPATEDIMQNLPKTVLEEGSSLLEKDCAVCKEQFQLGTDDPAEQIVVTLPCKHPFHESCIMPWLKSSGTCPVCRYELIAQPHHHGPGEGPSRSPNPPGANNDNRPGSPRTPFPGFGGSGSAAGGNSSNNNGGSGGGVFGLFTTLFPGAGTSNNASSHDVATDDSSSRPVPDGSYRHTVSDSHSRRNSASRGPNGHRYRRDGRRSSSDSSDGFVPGSWSDVD